MNSVAILRRYNAADEMHRLSESRLLFLDRPLTMQNTLLVGLGNPGPSYASNRHNVGFMALKLLAQEAGVSINRSKFKGFYNKGKLRDRSVIFLLPQTFMNLSGRSIQAACSFFNISPEQIIVLHDELDLSFGTLRLKRGGGHGGHNGLRSTIQSLGSREFVRLRLGIGRPSRGDASDFVLSNFNTEEREWLPDLLERTRDAILQVLDDGLQKAMNSVNVR